jgi:hypothetical protein
MQADDARAWVGTGCGIAHIASTIYDRGTFAKEKAIPFRRSCAGEIGLILGDEGAVKHQNNWAVTSS